VTVVHTLAASYVSQSAVQAGSAAAAASDRKIAKYSNLSSSHLFFPVAVETLSALADDGHTFIREIGRRAALNHVPLPTLLDCDSAISSTDGALAVSGGDWRLPAILALGMCGYTAVSEDGHTCLFF